MSYDFPLALPISKPMPEFASPCTLSPCQLQANEVHIWHLDIRQFTPAQRDIALQIMNDTEHTRADTFKRGKDEYIACRWLLRKVLAFYTGISADKLQFQRSDKGKPYLAQGNIQFSLSHSGHWGVLAVSDGNAVGIDIEVVQSKRNILRIAQHYYAPAELTQLLALPAREQQDYFYRLWTLKEALFKALGSGISAGLDKAAFELKGGSITVRIDPLLEAGADWQFQQWSLAPEIYGALALETEKAGQNLYPKLHTKWFDALALPPFP
jgi:4'-phosphopantetheinyl transferase